MTFQQMKLSASGQELGGDLLFGRRLGFSGTPPTSLPEEAGRPTVTLTITLTLTSLCIP